MVNNIMVTPSVLNNGAIFSDTFSKKMYKAYKIMKSLENKKYMKPHFSRCLEVMVNYLQMHNDYDTIQNDASSLKSKMSFFNNNNADIYHLDVRTNNDHKRHDSEELTPMKIENNSNFNTGNSQDHASKDNLKIK